MKYIKVWIEFEEYDDETGEETQLDDLSASLPFASSAVCHSEEEALEIAQVMHDAATHYMNTPKIV